MSDCKKSETNKKTQPPILSFKKMRQIIKNRIRLNTLAVLALASVGIYLLSYSASISFVLAEPTTIELKPRTARQAQSDLKRGADRNRLSRGVAGSAVDNAMGSIVSLGKSGAPVPKGVPIIDQSKRASESGNPGKIGEAQVPANGIQPPPFSTPPSPRPPSGFNPLQLCQQLLGLLQQANQQGQQGGGQQGGGQQAGGQQGGSPQVGGNSGSC